MKIEDLDDIVDPFGDLKKFQVVDIQNENDGEIITATLKSGAGNYYPVINGIPRILQYELLVNLAPVTQAWLNKYISKDIRTTNRKNIQIDVAQSFESEWRRFNSFKDVYKEIYDSYFYLWRDKENYGNRVLDAGCGMGRWAKYACDKTRKLFCVDVSQSIDVAQMNLRKQSNIFFVQSDLTNLPFHNEMFDSIYSLGVLHHIPDTTKAFSELTNKLKRNGSLLTYMYYAFDNRPHWFKTIFQCTNVLRLIISRLPKRVSYVPVFLLVLGLYLPLIYTGKCVSAAGLPDIARNIPLYEGNKNNDFYVLYNNSVDRFTTPLEKRYTKKEIVKLYEEFGFEKIEVQDFVPYWTTTGRRK